MEELIRFDLSWYDKNGLKDIESLESANILQMLEVSWRPLNSVGFRDQTTILEQQMNTVAVCRCALSVVHGIENFEKSICFIGKPSSH